MARRRDPQKVVKEKKEADRRAKAARKTKEADPNWREFERFVARLEQALSHTGVVVKHNDWVKDIYTGQSRQVDASIRFKIGSVEHLVNVECRDRSGLEDDTWMEQMATKQQKIGASRTIAVSSKGFYGPAKTTAKMFRIDLREVRNVRLEDIAEWCQIPGGLFVKYQHTIFHRIHFGTDKRDFEIDEDLHRNFLIQGHLTPLLEGGGRMLTPKDMMEAWDRRYEGTERDPYRDLKPNGPTVKRLLRFDHDPTEQFFVTCKGGGRATVQFVEIVAEYSVTQTLIPPKRVFQYRDADNVLVEGVEFPSIPDAPGTLSLLRASTGELTFQYTPDDPINEGAVKCEVKDQPKT